MEIALRVVQFWSEIKRVITDQIALHSVQLPLFMKLMFLLLTNQEWIALHQKHDIDIRLFMGWQT